MPESTNATQGGKLSVSDLRFLDGLWEATRALSHPTEVMATTARLLGEHLAASRCAYAQMDPDQDHFAVFGDYNRGVPSIVGRYAFRQFGAAVHRLMLANLPYVNDDVDAHPLTAGTDLAAYRQTQIRAVVCVPVHKDGRLVAAMAVHQDRPRAWRPDEVELIRTVVDRCRETLDRMRTEHALREANQHLSLALSAAELGDWSWDAGTDIAYLSDRASDMFGLPRGEPITWENLRGQLHPLDRQHAFEAVNGAMATGQPYRTEYRVMLPEGTRWLAAQGKITHRADGGVQGMIGVVQDVTAQRQAHEKARDEAIVFELLNRTGADLAGELDMQSLVQRVTDAATLLTGARFGAFFYNGTDEQGGALMLYTLSGAPIEAFEKLGHPRPTSVFGPTFNGAPPIRCDDILLDPRYGQWGPHHGMPEGHLPVRSYLAVPVVSRTGAVIGGLFFGHPDPGVFTERSERLAAGIASHAAIAIDNARLYKEARRAGIEREALLQSERAARREAERANAVKDEFLTTLSHELRTPLSAITGWVHVLRRQLAAQGIDAGKGLDVIDRNTRMQVKLIDDLLDMSRITSGKLRLDTRPVFPVDVAEAALEVVRHAAERAGQHIETHFDPACGMVMGDPVRLQQAVGNLLSNAVKFTPPGGRITLSLRRRGPETEITVQDTGMGVDPEFLPHIFDRFRQADGSTTRRFGGLGLGLSIVKHLVELHGGRIEAHSAGPGQGARFTIRLPRLETAVAEGMDGHGDTGRPLPLLDPADLSGLKVLVVDDDPDARELLRRVLEECGAQVTLADNGADALRCLPEWLPDVLVTDIGMPGMDGYELLRRVRRLGADAGGHLPAIALTAFARQEDRIKALRAGFLVHIAKPMEPMEVVASVASVAGRAEAGNSVF